MAMPQDPSAMVHTQLLPHLHLLSTFQFPVQQRIALEQAVNNLSQAGQIVREVKPMAWTYLNPQPDGTMFLTWQAPRMQNSFASDGYIWIDQEMSYRQNVRGYVVEILVHRAGYVFGHEAVSAHQRMRYHIISHDPSVPPIDPAYWLVHYSPSEPEARRPVQGLPIPPQVQKLMQERVFLEQQGAVLQRKEFMLMDRPNWPTVNTNIGVPSRVVAHPAFGSNQVQQHPMMAARQHMASVTPGFPPQQALQQPPQKRVKVDRGLATHAAQVLRDEKSDAIFEEDTEFGDYFDTLTPAEISKMRYKQHHEWMEEIFSSVYSISQIRPEDLGFGLTGSLKDLTDGILVAPPSPKILNSLDPEDKGTPVMAPLESNEYRKLSAEKMDEFEKRIAGFVEKGKQDIQAMKAQHAETVAAFNKSKTYMRAERKLREVNGGGDADAVVQEVEANLHAKITEQRSKVCVEEGGLEKGDRSRHAPVNATSTASPARGFNGNGNGNGNSNGNGSGNGNGNGSGHGSSMFETSDNSAANLLDEFGNGGSYTNSPAAPGASAPHPNVQTPGTTSGGPEQSFMRQAADAEDEGQHGTGLDLLEGMDVDIPDLGGDGTGEGSETKPGADDANDWDMVNDHPQSPNNNPGPVSAPVAPQLNPQTVSAPNQSNSTDQNSTTNTGPSTSHDVNPTSTHVEAPTSADDVPNEAAGMFDSADYGDTFDGLDTAGDALADYDSAGDEDDLGLDLGGGEFEGAFGDAGHHGA